MPLPPLYNQSSLGLHLSRPRPGALSLLHLVLNCVSVSAQLIIIVQAKIQILVQNAMSLPPFCTDSVHTHPGLGLDSSP